MIQAEEDNLTEKKERKNAPHDDFLHFPAILASLMLPLVILSTPSFYSVLKSGEFIENRVEITLTYGRLLIETITNGVLDVGALEIAPVSHIVDSEARV